MLVANFLPVITIDIITAHRDQEAETSSNILLQVHRCLQQLKGSPDSTTFGKHEHSCCWRPNYIFYQIVS